jgi:hypothetical protein
MTIAEQRAAIFYLKRKGGNSLWIRSELTETYEEQAYSPGAVKYWTKQFMESRTGIDDQARLGKSIVDISEPISDPVIISSDCSMKYRLAEK